MNKIFFAQNIDDGTTPSSPPAVNTGNGQNSKNVTAAIDVINNDLTNNGGVIITEYGTVWSQFVSSDADLRLDKIGVGVNINNGSVADYWTDIVSNLEWNTEYHFRAYAINSAGTTYGTIKDTTTDTGGGIPPIPSGGFERSVEYCWTDTTWHGGDDGMYGSVHFTPSTPEQSCSMGWCTKQVTHYFTGETGNSYTLDLSDIDAVINSDIGTAQVCWSIDHFANSSTDLLVRHIDESYPHICVRVKWGGQGGGI